MLPEPSGAGSLSPPPGLRTQVTMWSARIAGAGGIRVGAGIQQGGGEFEMRVADGEMQGAGAVARRAVNCADSSPGGAGG